MIKNWDYDCPHCGIVTRPYTKKIHQRVTCACGRRIRWARQKTKADLTTAFAGNYGKFEPALGCVVNSYEHKQEILKEQNVIEANDPVGGSRSHWMPDPGPREANDTTWVDNPEAKE